MPLPGVAPVGPVLNAPELAAPGELTMGCFPMEPVVPGVMEPVDVPVVVVPVVAPLEVDDPATPVGPVVALLPVDVPFPEAVVPPLEPAPPVVLVLLVDAPPGGRYPHRWRCPRWFPPAPYIGNSDMLRTAIPARPERNFHFVFHRVFECRLTRRAKPKLLCQSGA